MSPKVQTYVLLGAGVISLIASAVLVEHREISQALTGVGTLFFGWVGLAKPGAGAS